MIGLHHWRAVTAAIALAITLLGLNVMVGARPSVAAGLPDPGTTWTLTSGLPDTDWTGVAYGNGRFVAVANSGSDRVMTSQDGTTWGASGISGVTAHDWTSIAYGNGVFVAIAFDQSVMTSSDGLTWAAATTSGIPAAVGWENLTFGGGKFVAVGQQGTAANRVMTSTNGIAWSSGTIASLDATWHGVTYGGGMYVAVGFAAAGNASLIMTSSDGTNWSGATTPGSANQYGWSVTYGAGRFVAVTAGTPGTNQVMTSTDGTNWSLAQSSASSAWRTVGYGNGLFVAAGAHAVMTSQDGVTWTNRTNPTASSDWRAIAYQKGIFVAVGDSSDGGTGNRGMYSGTFTSASPAVTGVSPASGPAVGGTLINVTGTGFIPGLSVTVGGVACADVSVASSTSLTCTTPAGSAGAVAVAVTNLGQPAASLAGGFTFLSTQSPANNCVIKPKKLPKAGTTKIMKPKCVTTMGSAIRATAKARTPRGDVRYYRIVTTKSGTYIRTYGYQLNLTLTWKSKATTTATAYESSKLYRIR